MAQSRGYYVRRTQRRRIALVQEYKVKIGCRCGERDARALDLHHLNPDEKHTSLYARSASGKRRSGGGTGWGDLSYAEIVAELARCEVLCSNCHRKETHKPPLPSAPFEKFSPNEHQARVALGLSQRSDTAWSTHAS